MNETLKVEEIPVGHIRVNSATAAQCPNCSGSGVDLTGFNEPCRCSYCRGTGRASIKRANWYYYPERPENRSG